MTRPGDMDCAEHRLAVHNLVKLLVPEPERPDLERRATEHAAACEACREFLRICQEITCRELIDFLNDYIEGTLEPERREVFERHLAICVDCHNYLDSYRRTMSMSAEAMLGGAPPIDEPLPEDIVRAILAARRN